MSSIQDDLNWKSLYASDLFKWESTTIGHKELYYRRLGIVENMFDLDGVDYEGRADLNIHNTVEVKMTLSNHDLKDRIVLVWSCLRGMYPLLACQSLHRADFLPGQSGRRWIDKCFVYERPPGRKYVVESAQQHVVFVQDSYPKVNDHEFFFHLLNTGRAIDEKKALSKLFVLPAKKTVTGNVMLPLTIVAGHEIADGITAFRMAQSLVDLFNMNEQQLLTHIDSLCACRKGNIELMPLPQEALYPMLANNLASDRWNWAITRILRHVRKPPPASFANPLRREVPLQSAVRMEERFPQVLDYSKIPPLSADWVEATLSERASQNLIKLCRQAGISIGSGAFTLAGMTMMRFEETRQPDVPYWDRLPFVGSFPVNPRPFLSGTPTSGQERSLMLAFSDGVTLPFVPSDLDFVQTFRVLGRLAHRQLRQYQKRKRTPAEDTLLGSRSPRQLLPALYLSTMERLNVRAKPEQRVSFIPQTLYPAKQSPSSATCGISSVGDLSTLLSTGKYNLESGTHDLIADIREVKSVVRPREGEFLLGSFGMNGILHFRASCDGSAIDPAKAKLWASTIETVLDFDMNSRDEPTLGINKKLAKL